MDFYDIRFLRPAEKDLLRIKKSRIPTIFEAIESLKENGR